MCTDFFLSSDASNVKLAIQLLVNYGDEELGNIFSELMQKVLKFVEHHSRENWLHLFNEDVYYHDYQTVIHIDTKMIKLEHYKPFGTKIIFVPDMGTLLGDNIFATFVDNCKGISDYYRNFIK